MSLLEKYAFRPGCCTLDVASLAPDFTVAVRGPCYCCNTPQEVIVSDAALRKFRTGNFVAQACFPDLTADQREFLISGICGKCWDEMFADEGEDE